MLSAGHFDGDAAQSVASSYRAHSAADRSGTEITGYHHYRQEANYEWTQDDEDEVRH